MLKSAVVKDSSSPWIIVSANDPNKFWNGENWVKGIYAAKQYEKYTEAAMAVMNIHSEMVMIGEYEYYNGLEVYNALQQQDD